MNNNLLFDFTVDKPARTVYVNREFAAGLPLVWDAFTKQEILDQWWAPKPWVIKTKYMNFKVGGRRFYAMVSPEGQEYWSIQEFTSITPKTNFKYHNAFADKDENPQLPGSVWNLSFSEQNGVTKVSITITNESLARMEKMIEMGFKEGFTMTLDSPGEIIGDFIATTVERKAIFTSADDFKEHFLQGVNILNTFNLRWQVGHIYFRGIRIAKASQFET